MIKKILLLVLLVGAVSFPVVADEIKGKVVNRKNEPVDAMAVIVQTQDSVFVDAGITDLDGYFYLEVSAGEYVIYFQHILYEPLRMDAKPGDMGTVMVNEKENLISDITVTAQRPQVKVEAGKLIYDTPYLIQNKPVNNAYEAIKELPGVIGGEDELQLIGAGSLHVVINGKLTTMTLEQLIAMLKTIPSSRVKSTEIMYNAPARYNVKGALINVILDQPDGEGETLQGEVGTEFRQRHYANGQARGNLVYNNGRFGMDVLVNGQKGRSYTSETMFARHTLKDEKVEIEQENGGKTSSTRGSFRLGLDYLLKNEDKLSATYFIEAGGADARRYSTSVFRFLGEERNEEAKSNTHIDSNERMRNAQIQYEGHQGIVFGVDYTNYYSPDEQHFVNDQNNVVTDLLNNSKQNINKWMFFTNHSLAIKEWTMNYGVNVSTTRSRSDVDTGIK
ncbi:MAG: carboxypeptidase-like regulatory domain-containing protein [Tannerellaceae bacterium]|nr:carboxypeptidase-like regulatory domain-containing protein [Tannerellaceae bacterium]